MSVKCNLHTHTTYVDGKNTPEEMTAAAKRLGFSVLGFSEHAYNPLDLGCCLPEDSSEYYENINRLKKEYSGEMDVFLGLEIDAYEKRDTGMLDYFIGSIHGVRTKNGYFIVDGSREELSNLINVGCGGDALSAVKAYFDDYCAMAYALDPDIYGHFDLITKLNGNGEFFDETSGAYRKIALDALEAVREKGGIFEVNTGAIARGYRKMPYPSKELLKHLLEKGARITVTSDSHNENTLDCAFEETEKMLRELGFREKTILTKNGFIPVRL
ncbi:MAG: histidinol-phosphatase [Clostridia bacterium]|nr:histidinol-phosphatase [Clostridia bacterium]